VPLFVDDYLARFYGSATMMDLPVPLKEEELKAVINQLILKNNLGLSGVKMILTGGYSANGYDLADPNLVIIQQPFSLPDQSSLDKGIKIITQEYVREIPAAKTINYTMGIRLIKRIKEQEAEDVLYFKNGAVTEFPRCNFFIVRQDNTVVTPSENVLRGITRKNVLQLAGKKYKTEEGAITLDDIARAKEAFMTSTTKRILPIVQVDDHRIGSGWPGEVSLDLLQDLIKLEKGQVIR
jgi:branched-chain amino acid aminotransferase